MDVPGVSPQPAPQPLAGLAPYRTAAFALATAVALTAITGCNSSKAPEIDDAEARGAEIADRMLAAYRDARSYTDHATYVQSSSFRGEGVERELPFFEMSLAYRRPNFLRLRFDEAIDAAQGPGRGFDVAANGVVMRASAVEIPDQVFETAAPAKLTIDNFLPDPLIREVFNNRSISDIFPQLAMLLNEDDDALIFPADEAPSLLGEQDLNGRNCYRVASTSPQGKRVLWIDAENYLLRRMELPIEGQRPELDPDNRYASLSIWIDFHDPAVNGNIDDASFAKETAGDDRLVRRLVAAPPMAPPERLGKPLADFKFTTLDGKEVTRADLRGKTVLLDFWQLDCAPCKAHTPDLEKVFAQFKDNDKFAFYAVNVEPPARVSNEVAQRTLKNWGGTMPILRDPELAAFKELKVEGTPTLMLLDPQGNLQYFHIRQHRDPQQLAEVISKVVGGADLVAEARAEHAELVKKYESDVEAAAAGSGGAGVLEIEVARPEIGDRQLPTSFAASELWQAKAEEIVRPGNFLILNADGDEDNEDAEKTEKSQTNEQGSRILALDGGQAIVEFDAAGKLIARHEILDNSAVGNGFLRTAVDKAGHRLIAASGVGWQQLHLFDHQWKPLLAFPKDKNPGISALQLATLTPDAEPLLYVGYWGGVGIQGVALDGRRVWSERTLNQVVELCVAPGEKPGDHDLWATSDRGTIFVLDPNGKPRREIVVGLREIMHVAIRPETIPDAPACCGLAVESVGHYDVVGFNPRGDVAWKFTLPTGEYTHQVERIQSVTLPGGAPAWMIAAPDGTIFWLSPSGEVIDQFRYGAPLTGLSLTNTEGAAILLVSSPETLVAWKLGEGTAMDAKEETK